MKPDSSEIVQGLTLVGVGCTAFASDYCYAACDRAGIKDWVIPGVVGFLLTGFVLICLTMTRLKRSRMAPILSSIGCFLSFAPALALAGVFVVQRGVASPVIASRDAAIGGGDFVAKLHRNPAARLVSRPEADRLILAYSPPRFSATDGFDCKCFSTDLANYLEACGARVSVAVLSLDGGGEGKSRHAIVCLPLVDGAKLFLHDTPGRAFTGSFSIREVDAVVHKPFQVSRDLVTVHRDGGGVTHLVGAGKSVGVAEGAIVTAIEYF